MSGEGPIDDSYTNNIPESKKKIETGSSDTNDDNDEPITLKDWSLSDQLDGSKIYKRPLIALKSFLPTKLDENIPSSQSQKIFQRLFLFLISLEYLHGNICATTYHDGKDQHFLLKLSADSEILDSTKLDDIALSIQKNYPNFDIKNDAIYLIPMDRKSLKNKKTSFFAFRFPSLTISFTEHHNYPKSNVQRLMSYHPHDHNIPFILHLSTTDRHGNIESNSYTMNAPAFSMNAVINYLSQSKKHESQHNSLLFTTHFNKSLSDHIIYSVLITSRNTSLRSFNYWEEMIAYIHQDKNLINVNLRYISMLHLPTYHQSETQNKTESSAFTSYLHITPIQPLSKGEEKEY